MTLSKTKAKPIKASRGREVGRLNHPLIYILVPKVLVAISLGMVVVPSPKKPSLDSGHMRNFGTVAFKILCYEHTYTHKYKQSALYFRFRIKGSVSI